MDYYRTTLKKMILRALEFNNETEEDIEICVYRPEERKEDRFGNIAIKRLPKKTTKSLDDLPSREFDPGYGGAESPDCIVYTKNFIYIHCEYDGAEEFSPVPRNPENVGKEVPMNY